jgi:hypothetical protein
MEATTNHISEPMPFGEHAANEILDAIDKSFKDTDDYKLALESAIHILKINLEAA